MSLYPFADFRPQVADSAFIAPGARIIGQVTIGADSSVWYNCVLRGDVGHIRIGARTNIQDGSVVHVTGGRHNTEIGDDVLIGHTAIVHGCVLENGAFVGLGGTVMDGCVIAGGGMLAAGALLSPGKRIARGELWAGRPAKPMRVMDDAEIERLRFGAAHYVELARQHRASLAAISPRP